MPTPTARALSIQEQYALERIAQGTSDTAQALWAQSVSGETVDEGRLKAEYALLIGGAMKAAADVRAAYLQSFARANNAQPFTIPGRVRTPQFVDVLQPGVNPEGAINNVVTLRNKWAEEMVEARQALADAFDTSNVMAGKRLAQLAESTTTAAADYVTREVLGPDRRIAALRRVVHPGACERCVAVARVLVFKRRAQLRHDQCRCSFEPVFVNDADYQDRLNRYRANAGTVAGSGPGGSRWARDTRNRGRRQLEAANARENNAFLQASWESLLKSEELRLKELVKTVNSNSYRDWAVMTSVNQTKTGSGSLPVITRR